MGRTGASKAVCCTARNGVFITFGEKEKAPGGEAGAFLTVCLLRGYFENAVIINGMEISSDRAVLVLVQTFCFHPYHVSYVYHQ
jgi:hypothetical protein